MLSNARVPEIRCRHLAGAICDDAGSLTVSHYQGLKPPGLHRGTLVTARTTAVQLKFQFTA